MYTLFNLCFFSLQFISRVLYEPPWFARLDSAMPAATKLNAVAPLAQLEIAGKLISENLQADAARVPDLDNALVTGGGALSIF